MRRDGRPEEFVLLEAYEDQAALYAHKDQPHFAAFEDAVERVAVGAPNTLLTRIG